jgi:hypothetical protein
MPALHLRVSWDLGFLKHAEESTCFGVDTLAEDVRFASSVCAYDKPVI